MQARELRVMSPDELKRELHELLREQFNLRVQKATGQLPNPAHIRKVRRNIARVRTMLNEKARTAS